MILAPLNLGYAWRQDKDTQSIKLSKGYLLGGCGGNSNE